MPSQRWTPLGGRAGGGLRATGRKGLWPVGTCCRGRGVQGSQGSGRSQREERGRKRPEDRQEGGWEWRTGSCAARAWDSLCQPTAVPAPSQLPACSQPINPSFVIRPQSLLCSHGEPGGLAASGAPGMEGRTGRPASPAGTRSCKQGLVTALLCGNNGPQRAQPSQRGSPRTMPSLPPLPSL